MNQFGGDKVVIVHNLRVIVQNQLFAQNVARRPLNDVAINFGDAENFFAFAPEMVIFLKKLVSPRKFTLTAQFSVKPLVGAPQLKLNVLLRIVLEAIIDVIVTD